MQGGAPHVISQLVSLVTYVISGGNLGYNLDKSWLKIYLSYGIITVFKEVAGIRSKRDTKKLSKLTF